MKINQLMTTKVHCCRPEDSMATAAALMWDGDCGALPVVDAESQVVGVITDRDICMAAYTQGQPLAALRVETAMARKIYSVTPEDSVTTAEERMRGAQVRRLPVVDAGNHLVGIVTVNDLAREAERERKQGMRQVEMDDVAVTVSAIARPRPMAAAAA